MSGRDEALDGERLTVKESAQALGVSEKTVRGLIRRGELPAYDISKRVTWILRTDLEAFIESRRTSPAVRAAR